MQTKRAITAKILAVFLSSTLLFVPSISIAQSGAVETQNINLSNSLTAEEQTKADKLARDIITVQAIVTVMGERTRYQLISALRNNSDVSIDINAQQLNRINAILKREGVEPLPSSTRNFQIVEGGYAVGVDDGNGSIQVMTRSAGSTAWKITACTTAIGLAIYPGTKAYRLVKALGGIRQTAQLLINATTEAEKNKMLFDLGQGILGIEGVKQICLD